MPHTRTIRLERHEHLGRLLQNDATVLAERWTRRAVEEQPDARRVHHDALLDDMPAFLAALGNSLAQSDEESAPYRVPAIRHGEQRWEHGWSLPELVRDYQLLRSVVFEYLGEALGRPLHTREILAINLVFDEAVAASVGMYVASREDAVRRGERERVERERRAEEERLRGEAAALKEVDRRKDEFLAMLGHELRGPLAPIRNVVQVFQLGPPAADTVHWATGVVERQVRHLTRLVDDLLDVTRIARGKARLELERLDLAHLARVAAEDQRAAMAAAGVTLELHLESGPVWVRGDSVRLAQVVGNLLHNVRKFTHADGRVILRLECDREARRATVTVQDTGVGIDAVELPHLFETFRQADRSLHRSGGGLGLGLALVKGLVELHGGQVRAASAGVGQGAEFTLWIPLDEHAPPK